MKKISTFAVILLFWSSIVFGSDLSLSAKGGGYAPVDDELRMGYQAQVNIEWKPIYLFGQYLNTQRRIAGQCAGSTDIYGFGIGIDVPVHKYVSLWGQFGYYLPNSSLEGTWSGWGSHTFVETLSLYWRRWGEEHHYNVSAYTIYKYRIQPNFGGQLGIDVRYPLSKHLDIGFSSGYTFLKFQETFYAMTPCWTPTNGKIETIGSKNYSGFTFGMQATWRF